MAMVSLMNAESEMQIPDASQTTMPLDSALMTSLGKSLSQSGKRGFLQKNLIAPTIMIREGSLFNVLLTHDVHFSDYYHF